MKFRRPTLNRADLIIFGLLAPEGKLIGLMTKTSTIAVGAALEVPKEFAKPSDWFSTEQQWLGAIKEFSGFKIEDHRILRESTARGSERRRNE